MALVEAMLSYDPVYKQAMDVNAAPTYDKKGKQKYGGSSAYWMSLLKKVLIDKEMDVPY